MARLVVVTGILALIGVLLTGCGAGDDSAKVEASLHQYVGSLNPENAPFPIGAGIPRVQEKAARIGTSRLKSGRCFRPGM